MAVDVALGPKEGPVNICSCKPATVREVAEHIADEFGRRDLLQFGAPADNPVDQPCVIGICG
jgi:nucleoside-diphosphate-sugar epimerase